MNPNNLVKGNLYWYIHFNFNNTTKLDYDPLVFLRKERCLLLDRNEYHFLNLADKAEEYFVEGGVRNVITDIIEDD